MYFYFLTQKNMPDTFKNALKTGAIVAGLATSPALAETPNLNSATTVAVRESSIDSNQNLTKINTQIALTQNKIDILEQKNGLSDKELYDLNQLYDELQKLTKEQAVIEVSIKKSEGKKLDETVVIIDKGINTEIEKGKKLDEIKRILAYK